VFVSERRPMGLCRMGSTLYLVDPHGTLIDEFGPQYSEFDLPIIDGLVGSPSAGRPSIDEVRAELAARVIEALAVRKDIAQRISQIDVRDAHDAVVLLQDDAALLHLGEDRFLERVQSYVDLAPALRQRVPEIDYVDLRFDERVYVRPASVKR
jgi:cell division septal protein FtsQ